MPTKIRKLPNSEDTSICKWEIKLEKTNTTDKLLTEVRNLPNDNSQSFWGVKLTSKAFTEDRYCDYSHDQKDNKCIYEGCGSHLIRF